MDCLNESHCMMFSTTPQLTTLLRKASDMVHRDPKDDTLRVRFSLVWLSNAGFSTRQLTKTYRWLLT